MINLQIGFFLSFLGHILILLMITADFSIFYPKKNTYEAISVGFILEKQEELFLKKSSENLFSLKELEVSELKIEEIIEPNNNIVSSDLSIAAKKSLDDLKKQKYKTAISKIQKKFIDIWIKPFVLNEDIQVSILITLAPSGEILSRNLIESSGNKKFDESAMKAVSKINFLQDVSDLSRYDFEKYFREIDLVFKSR